MNPKLTEWLPYRTPQPHSRMRLFCFPYAGGSASIFARWVAQLAPEIEVCPVQLPGRENRIAERSFVCMNEVVERSVEALEPYLDVDYALFGHSLGALIAYEIAQHVAPREPKHLIVSGRRAPHILSADPWTWNLADPEFIKHLEELKGTPKNVLENKELMEILLPVIRADFRIEETYTCSGGHNKLKCPVTAFGGIHDDQIAKEELLAWQEVTSSIFQLRWFNGDHFFINHLSQEVIRAVRSACRIRLE